MSATPPFAALATVPGLARGHVRATLAEWGLGGLAEAVELIALIGDCIPRLGIFRLSRQLAVIETILRRPARAA